VGLEQRKIGTHMITFFIVSQPTSVRGAHIKTKIAIHLLTWGAPWHDTKRDTCCSWVGLKAQTKQEGEKTKEKNTKLQGQANMAAGA
jgi:phage-related protein